MEEIIAWPSCHFSNTSTLTYVYKKVQFLILYYFVKQAMWHICSLYFLWTTKHMLTNYQQQAGCTQNCHQPTGWEDGAVSSIRLLVESVSVTEVIVLWKHHHKPQTVTICHSILIWWLWKSDDNISNSSDSTSYLKKYNVFCLKCLCISKLEDNNFSKNSKLSCWTIDT